MAILLAVLTAGAFVAVRHRWQQYHPLPPWMQQGARGNLPLRAMRFVPAPPETPPGPPAQVAGGVKVQWPFTLLAVTRATSGMTPRPTEVEPAFDPAHQLSGYVEEDLGTTGLWVKVAGGLNVQAVPLPSGAHTQRIGPYTLITTSQMTFSRFGPSGGSFQAHWLGPNGRSLVGDDEPYHAELNYQQSGPAGGFLTLISSLARRFAVVAQPLKADGTPAGGAVSLRCETVGPETFYVGLPAGYSSATKAFRVAITDRQQRGKTAQWKLANLPLAAQHVPSNAQPSTRKAVGPLLLDGSQCDLDGLQMRSGLRQGSLEHIRPARQRPQRAR